MWFNKKEEKEKMPSVPELPRLPELPELPELPTENDLDDDFRIHKLPSFPNNSFGQKFSQNTIKDVVAGKKEDERGFGADDFAVGNSRQMMQRPLAEPEEPEIELPFRNEIKNKTREIPDEYKPVLKRAKETEPIFVRIDKFEESADSIEEIKIQITEMEKILGDIRQVKDKEEKEIQAWEDEIRKIKRQIEEINQNVFSKVR